MKNYEKPFVEKLEFDFVVTTTSSNHEKGEIDPATGLPYNSNGCKQGKNR